MFNRGFGAMPGMGVSGSAEELGQMARQYWGVWEQALRGAAPEMAPAPPPGGPFWQGAVQGWADAFAPRPPAQDAMARFGQQARDWYAQMQQVAAQFAGKGASPADVTQAWRSALGGAAGNPFQHMLDSMNGPGMQGMEYWLRSVQPVLDALTGHNSGWLNAPAFGFTREHQERLQALAAAQVEVQQASRAYQELLANASQAAFQRFEQQLSKRAAEGHSIDTPRALFDVWVDAAEEAYAQMALSESYRHAYGDLLNAQIRLRAGIQREVEHMCAQLGIPTRSELDGAHRKIIELERELRRMRNRGETGAEKTIKSSPKPARPATKTARPAKPATARPATKLVKNKAPSRKTATAPTRRAKKDAST